MGKHFRFVARILVWVMVFTTCFGGTAFGAPALPEDKIVWLDDYYIGEKSRFKNGLLPVRNDGGDGYVNIKGEEVIPCIFRGATNFDDNLAAVLTEPPEGGNYYEDAPVAIIDTSGKILVQTEYTSVMGFAWGGGGAVDMGLISGDSLSEGLCPVSKIDDNTNDDYYAGFINVKGELVIDMKFNVGLGDSELFRFDNGVSMALTGLYEDQRQVLINTKGKIIKEMGKYDKIDKKNLADTMFSQQYDRVYDMGNKYYFTTTVVSMWGDLECSILNSVGKEIYTKAKDMGYGYYYGKKADGTSWILNSNVEAVYQLPSTYSATTVGDDGTVVLIQEINPSEYKYEHGFIPKLLPVTEQETTQAPVPPASEYIYDATDAGDSLTLPTETLKDVNDIDSAQKAVNEAVSGATKEQIATASGSDKLTVFAEEAAANGAAKIVTADTIEITDTLISEETANVSKSTEAMAKALSDNGVKQRRAMQKTMKISKTEGDSVTVKKDSIDSSIDNVKIETSFASVSIPSDKSTSFTMKKEDTNKVSVKFDTGNTTKVKIAFPNISGNANYMAVVDDKGNPVGGKYNPATGALEAKIVSSGIYTVINNEKNFEDIQNKSQEMQQAIKMLASKGIINGTSEAKFSPDSPISRAEIAMLITKTLSMYDPNANGNFNDVKNSDWYFGAAGSAKNKKIISGYPDNTFRGTMTIPKEQIISVSARVLKNEMKYFEPENVNTYISTYADGASIAAWAKADVALATQANIVLKRTDNRFIGSEQMTRGDGAIILKRLFDKIW